VSNLRRVTGCSRVGLYYDSGSSVGMASAP